MADLIRDDVPPKSGPKWWVERMKSGETGVFTCFSRSIWGVWTHWSMYGSTPCFGQKYQCFGCANRHPKRWKGYVHCYDHHNKRQCFLELTPAVAESIISQIGEGQPIRGFRLKMVRGKGPKARVKVEVSGPITGGPEMPEEKCPEETLKKLWRMNEDLEEDGGQVEV